MLVLALGGKSQDLCQKLGISRTDGRTVAGHFCNGATKDQAALHASIPVMGIIIPTDHVSEGIITVNLTVTQVTLAKKFPVQESNGLEVGNAQHPFDSS
jgi:hypothetical protein